MHTFFASFSFMADHFGLLADRTVDHLKLSAAAVAVALVLALPLGVWLGHRGKGSFLTVSISNIGRALPSLALIAIFLGLLGIGFVNVLTALVVMAVPPVLTHAYLSVEQVDPDLVRAGRGMGLTEWQILTRIELPLALPVLFTGIRIAAVYVISSATLAAVAAWRRTRRHHPEPGVVRSVGGDRRRSVGGGTGAGRGRPVRSAAQPAHPARGPRGTECVTDTPLPGRTGGV